MSKQIVVMGPTASGKTRIAVQLAKALDSEIISADSRQLYVGGDLASGKDLAEYQGVSYHMIDVCPMQKEYSVFDFQRAALKIRDALVQQGRVPVISGGTQFYIESLLARHYMVEVPKDERFHKEQDQRCLQDIVVDLESLNGALHNTTDTLDKSRAIRSLEIALYSAKVEPEPISQVTTLIAANVLPVSERLVLIKQRLKERVSQGMIEEVESLIHSGVHPDRLEQLGLEYRYVNRLLAKEISEQTMLDELAREIHRFAKQQVKGLRRLERKGYSVEYKKGDETIDQFVARLLSMLGS